ncbi:MAG: elongation factor Ts [Dehalococcoidia bacterium]|nr:elongation factor Ts [Dehalococcoidia bacterium]
MHCKKALEQTNGDIDKATEILRAAGIGIASKKATRAAKDGTVDAYLHSGGRIGALVEVNCETDFVARTDAFRQLAHDLAMQVAAMNPKYISAEDIPAGEKVNPEEVCLLLQPFIKDSTRTIQDLITDVIARTGENIKVHRFARFALGE